MSTHTSAKLTVTESTYNEIRTKLDQAGYGELIRNDSLIYMTGIALIPQPKPVTKHQKTLVAILEYAKCQQDLCDTAHERDRWSKVVIEAFISLGEPTIKDIDDVKNAKIE